MPRKLTPKETVALVLLFWAILFLAVHLIVSFITMKWFWPLDSILSRIWFVVSLGLAVIAPEGKGRA